MKRVFKKSLATFLSLLMVLTCATALFAAVGAAEALPEGFIPFSNIGYFHSSGKIGIIAGSNDTVMTVREILPRDVSASHPEGYYDLNYNNIIVVGSDNKVISTATDTVDRGDVECPAGGYIICLNKDNALCAVAGTTNVGDSVELHNVNLADVQALAGTKTHTDVTDAGFRIVPPTPEYSNLAFDWATEWTTVDGTTKGTWQLGDAPAAGEEFTYDYAVDYSGTDLKVGIKFRGTLSGTATSLGNGNGTNLRLWMRDPKAGFQSYTYFMDVAYNGEGGVKTRLAHNTKTDGNKAEWPYNYDAESYPYTYNFARAEYGAYFEVIIPQTVIGSPKNVQTVITMSNKQSKNCALYSGEGFNAPSGPWADELSDQNPVPHGCTKIDNLGYNHTVGLIQIMAGDGMTVGDLTGKDLNANKVIFVNAQGEVEKIETETGRPAGVKTDMVCPAGGYIIGVHADRAEEAGIDNIHPRDKVTLYGVDLADVRAHHGLGDFVNLDNAAFKITPYAIAFDWATEWTTVDGTTKGTWQGGTVPAAGEEFTYDYAVDYSGTDLKVGIKFRGALTGTATSLGNGNGTNLRLWMRDPKAGFQSYTYFMDVAYNGDGGVKTRLAHNIKTDGNKAEWPYNYDAESYPYQYDFAYTSYGADFEVIIPQAVIGSPKNVQTVITVSNKQTANCALYSGEGYNAPSGPWADELSDQYPLPHGYNEIDNLGYNHIGGLIQIIAGDGMTVGDLTGGKDLNANKVIFVDALGEVLRTEIKTGRPDGVKTDMTCPAGGYIIGVFMDRPEAAGITNMNVAEPDTIRPGDKVTLYGVDLAAVRAHHGLNNFVDLRGAGFKVEPRDTNNHVFNISTVNKKLYAESNGLFTRYDENGPTEFSTSWTKFRKLHAVEGAAGYYEVMDDFWAFGKDCAPLTDGEMYLAVACDGSETATNLTSNRDCYGLKQGTFIYINGDISTDGDVADVTATSLDEVGAVYPVPGDPIDTEDIKKATSVRLRQTVLPMMQLPTMQVC